MKPQLALTASLHKPVAGCFKHLVSSLTHFLDGETEAREEGVTLDKSLNLSQLGPLTV